MGKVSLGQLGAVLRKSAGTDPDLDYLRAWAQPLGVTALLEECLHEP
ncbi:MAG TPA: hypothetical protein VK138_13385 [Acidiferrobacterales bacterium]|nr:hypothetical protein [Acidiferrobacterales bacterium]